MKTIKQVLGFIILIIGPIWIIQSVALIIGLVTGYETLYEFFNTPIIIDGEESSGISFSGWQLEFWTVIISSILLKLVGGKFSNLNYKNGHSDNNE
jgi:thiol:disulfide interchange protein